MKKFLLLLFLPISFSVFAQPSDSALKQIKVLIDEAPTGFKSFLTEFDKVTEYNKSCWSNKDVDGTKSNRIKLDIKEDEDENGKPLPPRYSYFIVIMKNMQEGEAKELLAKWKTSLVQLLSKDFSVSAAGISGADGCTFVNKKNKGGHDKTSL